MLISSQVYLEDICMERDMTLRDFSNCQNPGVRQNPYKYKIINIHEVFDKSSEGMTLDEVKCICTRVYLDKKDFPEELMRYRIHNIEPDADQETGCLYLKISVI